MLHFVHLHSLATGEFSRGQQHRPAAPAAILCAPGQADGPPGAAPPALRDTEGKEEGPALTRAPPLSTQLSYSTVPLGHWLRGAETLPSPWLEVTAPLHSPLSP